MARDRGARSASRRSFCRTFACALVPPGIATLNSKAVRRIGVLELGMPDTPELLWRRNERLREPGWVEGKILHGERRYARDRLEALQPLGEELVRAHVEHIVTGGTLATLAATRAIFSDAASPRMSSP